MLKIKFEDSLLDWLMTFKGTLSLPMLIIHCVSYIKNNNITLEELQNSQLRESQLRGLDYDRVKGFTKEREGSY